MQDQDDLTLTRRAHLQALLAAAITSSVPTRLLAATNESQSAVPEWSRLSAAQAETLIAVARTLFPHDVLSDRFYWPIASSIDSAMTDPAKADIVQVGLASVGEGFIDLDQPARESALAVHEGSPFFSFMYAETINGLYLNEEVWLRFGYEGSSIEHGGYIDRGFDDVPWLPAERQQ